MNRLLVIALLLAACKDSAGPSSRRGDPYTIIVPHIQFRDSLAQHYDLLLAVDEAGPTAPTFATEGGVDSIQTARGFSICLGLGTDSLGARSAWVELRSSAPSAPGDTIRSVVFDPANIPSADSANGYGQTYDKPYLWHWYISNDSSVVRGDTARYQVTPGDPATTCRF